MTTHMNKAKVLLIVTGLFWFSLYTYVPTLALYAQQLGASYDAMGLIVGSYGLVQLLLRIPLGILSDAWNCHKVFIFSGVVLVLVSSLGMWLLPAVGFLLLFRALSGVPASTWVNYTVLYAGYFPGSEAPKAMGYLNAVNNLGQVTAILAGGYAAQFLGITAPFVLSAAAACLALLLSLLIHAERRPRKAVNTATLREVMADDNLLRLSGLGVIVQIVTYVTIFGFLPLAAKQLGASHADLGFLLVAAIVPASVSAALSGSFFSKVWGERTTLAVGLTTMGLSCMTIPLIDSLTVLYIGQAAGGFGRGLVFPLLMGLCIKNFTGDKRSTAMGVFQAVYGLGMFAGPLLAGVVSHTAGLAAGFVVTGLTGLCGAVLAVWPRYLPLSAPSEK